MSAVFDIGPLTWVKSEIDSSLERARAALRAWVASPANLAHLKACQQHVHQASGAVQIVGLEGVSVFFAQAEGLLAELESGKLQPEAGIVSVLERAITAISKYLAELVGGAPDQPLRLYPEYRQLAEARKAPAPGEAELYFPDLGLQAPPRERPAVRVPPEQIEAFMRTQRAGYQRGFVRWMRDPANPAAITDMRTAVEAIERTQSLPTQRAFWWSAAAFFEALGSRALGAEAGVKQFAGRIEQQLRRMTEPGAMIPESLRREALYWLARVPAQSQNELLRAACKAFRLDGTLPGTAEAPEPPEAPLRVAALAALRESIPGAKDAWTRYASGAENAVGAFAAHARAAVDPAGALGSTPLAALAAELARVGAHLEANPGRISDAAATEVATALLILENAVSHSGQAAPDLERQVSVVCERLAATVFGGAAQGPLPSTGLVDELTRQAQEKLASGAVLAEIQANLQRVEQLLDAYFRDPAKTLDQAAFDPAFHQVSGALRMLGEEEARGALDRCAAKIRGFAMTNERPAPAEFEEVAQILSGLGFYVESLRQGNRADFASVMQPLGTQAGATLDEAPPFVLEPLDDADAQAATAEGQLDLDGVAAPAEMLAPATDAAMAVQPLEAILAAEGSSEEHIDQELLTIFLEEAHEVLAAIQENLTACRQQPASTPHLTGMRRSFHTLKGSGRMVGLMRLGEAAWAIEQVMNRWLQEERAASADLVALIERAQGVFTDWVSRLELNEEQPDPGALIEAAERVRRDEPIEAGAPPAAEAIEVAFETEPGGALDAMAELLPQEAEGTPEVTLPDLGLEPLLPPIEFVEAGAVTGGIEEPLETVPEAQHEPEPAVAESEPEYVRIGDSVVSSSLFSVFTREASQFLEMLERELALAATLGGVGEDLVRAAHTFGGICGTVQIGTMHRLGYALESALRRLQQRETPPDGAELRLLAYCIGTLRAMYGEVLEQRAPRARDDLIGSLDAIQGARRAPPIEHEAAEASRPALAADVDTATDAVSTEDLSAALDSILSDLARESTSAAASPAPADDRGATDVGLAVTGTLAPDAVSGPEVLPQDQAEAQEEEIAPERRQRRIDDDIDPDLLPVFLAEAHELAPQAGELLRTWRKEPGNPELAMALQRVLHTFKGGARMAGVMSLGELTHSMETRVENAIALQSVSPQFFDELDTSYDRVGMLLEGLQKPEAAPPEAAPGAAPVPGPQPAAPEDAIPAAPLLREGLSARALLRVQAEMLEKLVNRAGEVSVTRSRVETEMRTLKGALADLTENIGRLRGQLREIEIQAELQMQARAREVEEKAQGFDPLEFDRFTRVQELTRMMAESVNDVSTVQQGIARSLGDAETALSEQARLSRELQQDLMRVRMVPLNSIADRLHRLVRQTAKELGKRANFDIRGGNIEMDRSVLERITGPLEHLLRNSITHGIEDAAERIARGKPEFGEIRLDVRQDGNEVVLTYADDGGGLDLQRIRAKAVEKGLLAPEDRMDDERLAELIFLPGFSTVEQVTEVAGRGVGMDVVREEVRAIGGRVALGNTSGQGASFTIRLPLTTAVTQTVLVKSGARTCALPAVTVEQVQRFPPKKLAAVREAGRIVWAGRDYPFAYLPDLLGEAGAPSDEARLRAPVLLVRSGGETVALLVDDIIANQEVVVKNLGPQLARVPGVAGVTVLGTGEIVLILNPVPLLKIPRAAAQTSEAAEADAPHARTVMVVDDSLTVRKITGRLLTREGYHVLTAKDGIEALEQLDTVVPDAMLVDIEMPRMDGFDLTRNLRADARLKRIPIVMITSRAADKHRAFALAAGVDVFLGKPYREDELLEHLSRLIGGAPVMA